jgi:hypothetical protein
MGRAFASGVAVMVLRLKFERDVFFSIMSDSFFAKFTVTTLPDNHV